jgi:predicted RNase H-like HicB family nuclease
MIYRENDGSVSLCPELGCRQSGDSVEDASANLREAVELFIEAADQSKIAGRFRPEIEPSRSPTARY